MPKFYYFICPISFVFFLDYRHIFFSFGKMISFRKDDISKKRCHPRFRTHLCCHPPQIIRQFFFLALSNFNSPQTRISVISNYTYHLIILLDFGFDRDGHLAQSSGIGERFRPNKASCHALPAFPTLPR